MHRAMRSACADRCPGTHPAVLLASRVGPQTGCEKVWERTTLWRHSEVGTLAATLSTVLFLWWPQHVLLGERIAWRALLPGAIATALGLLCLRVLAYLVFSSLIASSAVPYGMSNSRAWCMP